MGAHYESVSIFTLGQRVQACESQLTRFLAKGMVTRWFVSQGQITGCLTRSWLLDILSIEEVIMLVCTFYHGNEVCCLLPFLGVYKGFENQIWGCYNIH